MKFPVGTTYQHRGRTYTVTDYHVTRNLAGDVVRERYVAEHELCGQRITDRDIVETTIAKAIWYAEHA